MARSAPFTLTTSLTISSKEIRLIMTSCRKIQEDLKTHFYPIHNQAKDPNINRFKLSTIIIIHNSRVNTGIKVNKIGLRVTFKISRSILEIQANSKFKTSDISIKALDNIMRPNLPLSQEYKTTHN